MVIRSVVPACLLLLLCGCSGPLQSVEMDGYNGDLLQMKYRFRFEEQRLDNGRDGYLETVEVHYSRGARERYVVTIRSYLETDFSLYRVEREQERGTTRSKYVCHLEADELVKTTTEADGKTATTRASVSRPLYRDIPPLMFAGELSEPGSEKTYRLFDTGAMRYLEKKISYIGETEVESGGKRRRVLRYQVQNPSAKEDPTSYYLDPETKEYVRIEQAMMVFVLP